MISRELVIFFELVELLTAAAIGAVAGLLVSLVLELFWGGNE